MAYSTGYKTKFNKRDHALGIVVLCGAIPLCSWRFVSGSPLSEIVLRSYLLTAPLFGYLLPMDYPPFRSRWFWKAMAPVSLLHIGIVATVGKATLYFAAEQVKLPVSMVFGFLTAVAFVEYRVALRLIRALEPKHS